MILANPLANPLGNPLDLPRVSGVAKAIRGEASWTVPGTYQFIVPAGVKSICGVAIGGGGGGPYLSSYGGGGGSLGWANNIAVSPGQTITIVVGNYGSANPVTVGGDSYISLDGGLTKAVNAPGGRINGNANVAPTPNGGIGGIGGAGQWAGGGGTGGYLSAGGKGGGQSGGVLGAGSSDGGAGGSYNSYSGGGVGGGAWLYGSIAQGNLAGAAVTADTGGGVSDGFPPSRTGLNFNMFWGGGGGWQGPGSGAVRILWGDGRAFPATDVGIPQ